MHFASLPNTHSLSHPHNSILQWTSEWGIPSTLIMLSICMIGILKWIKRFNHISLETATIENKGQLATHVARGAQLAGNREDVVWLIGDRDKVTFLQGTAFQKLGVMEGVRKIPGYSGKESPAQPQQSRMRFMRRSMPPGYPMERMRRQTIEPTQVKQTGPKRDVKWLVAVEGNTPLKIVVTSQKGGTKVKNLTIQ